MAAINNTKVLLAFQLKRKLSREDRDLHDKTPVKEDNIKMFTLPNVAYISTKCNISENIL